jgi:hypothetical protein
MAHADQTRDAKIAFAEYHILRVKSGEAAPTLGPAHFDLTPEKWAEIEARIDTSVRKAAARLLLAA